MKKTCWPSFFNILILKVGKDGRRTKEELENKAVRFSKQLTLLAAPPKTEPPCIPLSKDLLVCGASSSHQNSPSIFLICRSRNITGTCTASTNGRPASCTNHRPPLLSADSGLVVSQSLLMTQFKFDHPHTRGQRTRVHSLKWIDTERRLCLSN